MTKTLPRKRIDWRTERERIDLAALVTSLLGPAPGRRGEHGRRLWWRCPLHDDQNPSFSVEPGKGFWRCFGCGESGDAATLVMRLEGVAFPEAVRRLTGESTGPPLNASRLRQSDPTPSLTDRTSEPTGMHWTDAQRLVEVSADRLWTPEGGDALEYLRDRGLTDETIRAARLGWTPNVMIPTRDGDRCFRASGVTIPWLVSSSLALVKLRQPEGRHPKYAEAFRDPSRLVCFPGPETIKAGRPLIVVEGEFDALLLSQLLGGLASVVTLGSASHGPKPEILGRMLAASPWYAAHDADPAGDNAASAWPARTRRVRPPSPSKDWTEAHQRGVDLRRWWSDVLNGFENPPLYSWDQLASWRWGPARDDPAPGIVSEGSETDGRSERLREILSETRDDPYAVAEREAIRDTANEDDAF